MTNLTTKIAARCENALVGDATHGHVAATARLRALAMREAQVLTYADAFLIIAICFLLVNGLVPFMQKVAPPSKPSTDAH